MLNETKRGNLLICKFLTITKLLKGVKQMSVKECQQWHYKDRIKEKENVKGMLYLIYSFLNSFTSRN